MSLLNLITQDPHDEASKQRHKRLIQKLSNAAQTSFARHALDQDYIRFLHKMNKEATARRKTKSNILGKAKVMSYDDLEAARVKRAEKEAAKEAKGKGKRERRPKSAPTETEEVKENHGTKEKNAAPEPVVLDTLQLTAKGPWTSGTQVADA